MQLKRLWVVLEGFLPNKYRRQKKKKKEKKKPIDGPQKSKE